MRPRFILAISSTLLMVFSTVSSSQTIDLHEEKVEICGLTVIVSGLHTAGRDVIPFWDWGDNKTDTLPFPALHEYANPGKFKVTASIKKRDRSASDSLMLFVGEDLSGDLHCLRLDPPSIDSDRTVTVNGVTLSTIKRIQWNWGDGTIQADHEFPNHHQYKKPGTYIVQVITVDAEERYSIKTLRIRVP